MNKRTGPNKQTGGTFYKIHLRDFAKTQLIYCLTHLHFDYVVAHGQNQ